MTTPLRTLENKIPPPALVILVAAGMWLATNHWRPVPINPVLHFVLTTVIGILALTFGLSGILAFRRARTTIDPVHIEQASRVVNTGIYRLTRNPMYVGLTGLLTMWAVHLAVPLVFAGPVAFAVFVHFFQVLPEERVMERRFGSEYLAYKAKVRRWL
jgi:protein-S-isoprenylcysteine O-methyltransferase Ste14